MDLGKSDEWTHGPYKAPGKEISQRTEQIGEPCNFGHLANGGDLVLEVMSPIVEHLVYDKSAALWPEQPAIDASGAEIGLSVAGGLGKSLR